MAKLEIQNNLLRDEILSSQNERIKLLKESNELKNKIEEEKWKYERGDKRKVKSIALFNSR